MNVIYVIHRKEDSETSLGAAYSDTRKILAYTTEARARVAMNHRFGKQAEDYEIIEFTPKRSD